MDTVTFALIILVFNTNIQDNHATETVHLEVQAGQVSVYSTLTFVCSTSSPATIINWFRTTYGSSEQTAVIQQVVGGACFFNAPDDLECFCNTTMYKCAIKSVNATQAGEKWRCSASINGFLTFSNNTYTIQLGSTTKAPTFGTTEESSNVNTIAGGAGGGGGAFLVLVIILIVGHRIMSSKRIKDVTHKHKSTKTVFEKNTQTGETKPTQTDETHITKTRSTQIETRPNTKEKQTMTKKARQTTKKATQTTKTLTYAWKKTQTGEDKATQFTTHDSTIKTKRNDKINSTAIEMGGTSDQSVTNNTESQEIKIGIHDALNFRSSSADRSRTVKTQTYTSSMNFKRTLVTQETQTSSMNFKKKKNPQETQTDELNMIEHITQETQTDAIHINQTDLAIRKKTDALGISRTRGTQTTNSNTETTFETQLTKADEAKRKPKSVTQMSQAYTMYSQHNVVKKHTQTDLNKIDLNKRPKTKNEKTQTELDDKNDDKLQNGSVNKNMHGDNTTDVKYVNIDDPDCSPVVVFTF